MSAHTVSHNVQAILRHDREVVLVVRAFAADVRLASDFDTQGPIQAHIPWKSGAEPR
jgi:hypothetical protein